MNELVLLNKDGSCRTIKDGKRIEYDDVKYILVPIVGFDTHIAIKSNKYVNFTKAKVSYDVEIVSIYSSDDDYNDTISLNETNIETKSVVELYNLLHSLHRIDYSNSLENLYDVYNGCDGNYLHISRLAVTLYNDKDVIYDINYIDKKPLYGMNFTHHNIIKAINDIYKIYNNKDNDYLIIRNNRWEFNRKIKKDSIVGIPLTESCSIYMMQSSNLDLVAGLTTIHYTYHSMLYDIAECTEIYRELDHLIGSGNLTDDDVNEFIDDHDADVLYLIDNTLHSTVAYDNNGDINENYVNVLMEFLLYINIISTNYSFIYHQLYDDVTKMDTFVFLNAYISFYGTDPDSSELSVSVYTNDHNPISFNTILNKMVDRMKQ